MLNSEMTRLTLEEVKLTAIDKAAGQIIAFAGDVDVWVFEGQMGAGKTTLVKAICKKFGIVDNVTSPTFSIVNEYLNANDVLFYHFDLYRIEKEMEAEDIGCGEYFYSGNKCFVEWPSKIPNLLPERRLEIDLLIVDDFTRSINVTKHA